MDQERNETREVNGTESHANKAGCDGLALFFMSVVLLSLWVVVMMLAPEDVLDVYYRRDEMFTSFLLVVAVYVLEISLPILAVVTCVAAVVRLALACCICMVLLDREEDQNGLAV